MVNDICSNDAAIEAIAVALTVYGWAKSTYAAGKAARQWWESDSMENGSHVVRLIVGILYVALALVLRSAWQYFTTGKAQAHWAFVNDVVDDGLGLYGSSPMGNAVARWVSKHSRRLMTAIAQTCLYVLNRVSYAVAVRYGAAQARVFAS